MTRASKVPPNRRQVLAAFGSVGLGALVAACSRTESATTSADVVTSEGAVATVSPQTTSSGATAQLFEGAASCTLTREETEGPYYFDVDSIRSDIREDREGVPLRLAIRVQDADRCGAIANGVVDIWHCDAAGSYSGFESASQGQGGGGRGSGSTDDETYLRGAQVTNADGIVEFLTVYPGWYRGRTVHIHAKVHIDKQTVLTTQLFFEEGINEQVYALAPYASRTGRSDFNGTDNIFDDSLVLTMREVGDGWLGIMTFGVEA